MVLVRAYSTFAPSVFGGSRKKDHGKTTLEANAAMVGLQLNQSFRVLIMGNIVSHVDLTSGAASKSSDTDGAD